MTRFDLSSRIVTAAALVALAVTIGVWLTHAPLTAAPPPVPADVTPEPTLAPPPLPIPPTTTPATIQVPVEGETAPVMADPPAAESVPAAEPAKSKPEPQSDCQQPRRRGVFGRRR